MFKAVVQSALVAAFCVLTLGATNYDVKTNFGATGNGSTNDTSAIQAAVNSCHAGDILNFPAGTYMVDTITKSPSSAGCKMVGPRATAVLKARTQGQGAIIYTTSSNFNDEYYGLTFDLDNKADAGLKYDWQTQGLVVQYCVFKNGGPFGTIFLPSATTTGGRRNSIDHNIFKNVRTAILSYNKYTFASIDYNYFDTFWQGVSGGGCNPNTSSLDTTVDHNFFTQGRRMAVELCGSNQNQLSLQYNYLSNWLPSEYPVQCVDNTKDTDHGGQCEAYNVCGGQYPYMCSSMGFSIATGGYGTVVSHNRMYRQQGTSWGIEYTVRQTPTASFADDNIIKGSVHSIQDEASADISLTRSRITNNYGCGGVTDQQLVDFSRWPASNHYFSSCTDPSFPVEEAPPAPPFDIVTGALPGGTTQQTINQSSTLTAGVVGTAYSLTFTASGGTGPYTWALVSGTLPTGLSLTSSGVLSGTPTVAATYNFTISSTDTGHSNTLVSKGFSLVINPTPTPPHSINDSTPLTNGYIGTAYALTLTTSGGVGPYTYAVSTGTLPTGITLASNGALTGTPTVAGQYTFSVISTDTGNSNTPSAPKSLDIFVFGKLLVTTLTIPSCTVSNSYTTTLAFTGGDGTSTWSLNGGTLPPGLSLGSSDGVLSGTPTTQGTYPFTVQVFSNDGQFAQQTFTLEVGNGAPIPRYKMRTSGTIK